MDAKLQTLLHAYGEPLPTGVPPQPVDEEEARAFEGLRAALDARPRNAPDAAVLDVIFRAAAHGAPAPPQPGLRHDRAPTRHARLKRRGWAMVGLACSLALGGFALSLSLTTRTVAPTTVTAPAAERMLAATPTASVDDREVAPPAPAPARASAPAISAPAAPPAAEKAAPAPAAATAPQAAPEKAAKLWTSDEGDVQLDAARAKTERLRTRLDSGLWDAPAVTLTLPAPTPRGGRFSAVSSGN